MDEKNVLEKWYKIMDKRQEHFDKVKTILTSCKNTLQLKTAVKVTNQFIKQYKVGETDPQYMKLKQLLELMKIKCRVNRGESIDESLSSSGSEFKAQAGLSGVPELQKLKFEDEIKGGKSDKKTPKDLAKKHNVRLKDIVDEIKVGKNIEREHTKSDDISKEIAMDHIDEFPDYYTNPKYGLKTSEKGLEKYNEVDYDRVLELMKDKGWGDNIYNHQDDFESSDYYDNENNPEDYADAFDQYMYDLSNGNIDFDIEESTTAGSSGSFVGALGSKPIKRKFHKGNVPVSDAGGMTKPIGKIRSFRKRQLKESNVYTKKEMIESTDGGSIATYDSPGGWGNNEFMGTKGKKGNAIQRKGNDYKKTYDYDTGSSTFVKIKDKCKKFPYCNQDSNAIELSKTPFKEGVKDIIPNKQKIKDGWIKFSAAAKREGKETTIAAKILKKVILNKEVSEDEYRFLKKQSVDIAKIFGVLMMGAISAALPILLEKILNKKGISILPTENKPLKDNNGELIESICKKTGKSKKYVHSLIDRYL